MTDERKTQAAIDAVNANLEDLQIKEAEADTALVTEEKLDADAEKKRADAVLFEISGPGGRLVCRCRIPTDAMIQYGVFRILTGTSILSHVTESVSDMPNTTGDTVSIIDRQQKYELRSVYGQRKRTLEFCNSTYSTETEKKFCILHLLENIKDHTM